MRDTKTKGDVIPNFSRLVPCCYLVYFLMEKIMKQSLHVFLLLQVYGFGVLLLRWMLMVPKFLSFI